MSTSAINASNTQTQLNSASAAAVSNESATDRATSSATAEGDAFTTASSTTFSQLLSAPANTTATTSFEDARSGLAAKNSGADALLDNEVEINGTKMTAEEALESGLEDVFKYLDDDLEAATYHYKQKFEGTDPRAAFLWTVGNMIAPKGFPGRVSLVQKVLMAPIMDLERDLQEMAMMAGEVPFGFEDVADTAKVDIGYAIGDVVGQLDGTDAEKQAIINHYTEVAVEAMMEQMYDEAPYAEGASVDVDLMQESIKFCASKWAKGFFVDMVTRF